MERDINQQTASTVVCRGGCGFYGSPATDGLCSKCFKDSLKRKQDPTRVSPTSVSAVDTHSVLQQATTSLAAAIDKAQQSASEAIETEAEQRPSNSSGRDTSPAPAPITEPVAATPPKKNRCKQCNKKVGLTGFPCRCGDLFCGEHRYSDTHQCPFDYKALGASEIRKNNPVIVSQKITKI